MAVRGLGVLALVANLIGPPEAASHETLGRFLAVAPKRLDVYFTLEERAPSGVQVSCLERPVPDDAQVTNVADLVSLIEVLGGRVDVFENPALPGVFHIVDQRLPDREPLEDVVSIGHDGTVGTLIDALAASGVDGLRSRPREAGPGSDRLVVEGADRMPVSLSCTNETVRYVLTAGLRPSRCHRILWICRSSRRGKRLLPTWTIRGRRARVSGDRGSAPRRGCPKGRSRTTGGGAEGTRGRAPRWCIRRATAGRATG